MYPYETNFYYKNTPTELGLLFYVCSIRLCFFIQHCYHL